MMDSPPVWVFDLCDFAEQLEEQGLALDTITAADARFLRDLQASDNQIASILSAALAKAAERMRNRREQLFLSELKERLDAREVDG